MFARPATGVRFRPCVRTRGDVPAAGTPPTLDVPLAQAPVRFVLVDRGRRIVRLNDAMARMSRIPAERQLGRRVDEVLEGDRGPAVAATVDEVLASGRASSARSRWRTR